MRFEELKSRFWDDTVDLEVFAPLTPADVACAESVLGVRLPVQYVELLKVQNGGYVSHEFDALPTDVPTSWAEDHVWFRTLAGIGPADAWPAVTMNAGLLDEWKMPTGLVPLSGDGHFWIALDYRGRAPDDEPSVVWYDNEVDEDLTIAPSFLAFVEGLVPMERFAVEDPETDLPTVHVARGESGSTYCGYSLGGALTWIPEELLAADSARACPDCLRLMDEWNARG